MCDPETGTCEIPGAAVNQELNFTPPAKKLRVIYFTDPICSSCWGIEPQLRKLKLEYGHMLDFEYYMGGLLPGWSGFNGGGISSPADVAVHWDEAGLHYQMPLTGDVCIEDPMESSYPSSIAFKAAQMQDAGKAVTFLRKVREMLFTEKKNISKQEHLEAAADYAGLNVEQFVADYKNKAEDLFKQDLAYSRQLGVRGFPTIFIVDADNNHILVYGSRPYSDYESAIKKLVPDVVKKHYDNSPQGIFNTYETLATKEFAELTHKTMEEAFVVLSEMEAAGQIERNKVKTGDLWLKK